MSVNVDLRRVHRQLRDYLRSLGWVLRDGGRRFAKEAAFIAAVSLLGVASGAVSIGGIVGLAKYAGQSEPWRIAGFELKISDGVVELLAFASVLAAIGLLSGFCLYMSERMIMRVTRTYEAFNRQRVMELLDHPKCRGWTDLLDRPVSRSIMRLTTSGSRYTAYALRDMLRGILPIATLTVSLAALLWIDSLITVLLVPLVLAYLAPLYAINLRVARIQQEYRQLGPVVRRRLLKRVRTYTRVGESDGDSHDENTNDRHEPDESDRFSALHYKRMLAAKRVHFLNTAFTMLCLLALIAYFTIAHRSYGREWSDLLAYIIALRFSVSALRGVSTIFVLFSRFLPEYRAYALAIEGAERIAKRRGESKTQGLPGSLTIKLGSRTQWASDKRVTFEVTKPLFVLVPRRVGPCDLGAIASRIEHRLVEQVDFAGQATIKSSTNGVATKHTSEIAAPPEIVTADVWKTCPTSGNTFTVIVGSRAEVALRYASIGSIVVMDDRKIIGGGDSDWLRRNLDSIRATLAEVAEAESRGADDEDDDLEDEFE